MIPTSRDTAGAMRHLASSLARRVEDTLVLAPEAVAAFAACLRTWADEFEGRARKAVMPNFGQDPPAVQLDLVAGMLAAELVAHGGGLVLAARDAAQLVATLRFIAGQVAAERRMTARFVVDDAAARAAAIAAAPNVTPLARGRARPVGAGGPLDPGTGGAA